MHQVEERFLKYVGFDTTSCPDQEQIPSTQKQFALAKALVEEMQAMGLSRVRMDEHGYVYAALPATDESLPTMGLIAHMDTSPDCSGTDIKAQKLFYAGGDLLLNKEKDIWLREEDFPGLKRYVGQHLICTDGTTLLGADDKAGIAEILTAVDRIAKNDRLGAGFPHGEIAIGFTPDEEVGRGADLFDVAGFGAAFAYTVDGGTIGELEHENFNAASLNVTVKGVNIHPGTAKDKMKNALEMAMEYAMLLPSDQKPQHTEGYEGFFHLHGMDGNVEEAHLSYIIRDHDREKFEEKKALAHKIGEELNDRWGEGSFLVSTKDSYYNMKEKIEPYPFLIENAKAAMKEVGIAPLVQPIRGGTDGARLSFEGLPCPNLCTGGENFHGRFEFICCESMEKIVLMLEELVRITYANEATK